MRNHSQSRSFSHQFHDCISEQLTFCTHIEAVTSRGTVRNSCGDWSCIANIYTYLPMPGFPWRRSNKLNSLTKKHRPLLLGRVMSAFQPLRTRREGGAVETVRCWIGSAGGEGCGGRQRSRLTREEVTQQVDDVGDIGMEAVVIDIGCVITRTDPSRNIEGIKQGVDDIGYVGRFAAGIGISADKLRSSGADGQSAGGSGHGISIAIVNLEAETVRA